MKRILFLGIALMASFVLQETAGGTENRKEAADGPRAEKYYYEATSVKHQTPQKNFVEMEFTLGEAGIEYHSRSISSGSSEEIFIQMDKEARFVSGIRRTRRSPDKAVHQDKIWRDRDKVVVERHSEGGRKRRDLRLPPDEGLAVDGSLLALLRLFPFDEGRKWNLFMVDFSGYSITVSVFQDGRERIAVPAGEFECYRMVTVVNIPVFKPKITFWISTQKPHFMVKHRGRSGPFTPFYTTSLMAIE